MLGLTGDVLAFASWNKVSGSFMTAHMLGLNGNISDMRSSWLSLAPPLVSQRCDAQSEGRPQCAVRGDPADGGLEAADEVN